MRGVVLYGPPASGKDTVTAALREIDPQYELYPRLKVGSGRSAGYRMGTEAEASALRSAGEVVWENQRYEATYVVDRNSLVNMLISGSMPVVHLGQATAVTAVTTAVRSAQWLAVYLWCPRDEAAARIAERGTGDTTARLNAWDETEPLPDADLVLNTAELSPDQAATEIHARVGRREQTLPIALPAPTFRRLDGSLDGAATERYAQHIAGTWADHVIVSGPMGAGEGCTPDERARLLDLWSVHMGPGRVVGACWEQSDLDAAQGCRVRPLVMLQAETDSDLLRSLERLPREAIAYTNPRYSRATLTPDMIAAAKDRGVLPSAIKLSKVKATEITQIRSIAGPWLQIIHGSSRDISGSITAGADVVVASPLATLPHPWPEPSINAAQQAADAIQGSLDACADHPSRVQTITALARKASEDTPPDPHQQEVDVRKTDP